MQSHATPRMIALALAASAIAWPAGAGNDSRAKAYPVSDGLIEVVADFSENSLYWCGAALFAAGSAGASSSDRIYVWRGPGPSLARPGAVAVRFGLTPPSDSPAGGLTTNDVGQIGNSMSLAQAQQTCNERSVSQ